MADYGTATQVFQGVETGARLRTVRERLVRVTPRTEGLGKELHGSRWTYGPKVCAAGDARLMSLLAGEHWLAGGRVSQLAPEREAS